MAAQTGIRLTTMVVVFAASIVICWNSSAQESKPVAAAQKTDGASNAPAEKLRVASSPAKQKPLSSNTKKALEFLIEQQNANGGWGQGGGWRQASKGQGRVQDKDAKDLPDLANTCIAALAFIRAGNTTETGEYAKQLAKAVDFICARVENADADSLYVTDVRDTQLQSKIGPYVGTFLTGLVLSELKGKAPAEGADKRMLAALDKTVRKIEKNQKTDGTFAGNTGWASVLSQGLASKFVNRAAQNSVKVNAEVLERDYKQTVAGLDKKTGDFGAAAAPAVAAAAKPVAGTATSTGSTSVTIVGGTMAMGGSDAGVKLYNSSSNAGRLSDLGNTAKMLETQANKTLADEQASQELKTKAKADLVKVADIKEAQQAAVNGIIRQLDDKKFIAGFGNNGGEEFLSYMNISEMLVVSGGPKWESWDKSVTENLNRNQNKDGSWSGDHCITGRTFCTAAALLTLMADRTPVPVAAKAEEKAKAPADGSGTPEK